MSAIKFACISPHPPIIVHEVGRGREREGQRPTPALEQVAADIGVHRPETVLLMATHGPLNPGAFVLLTAPEAQGDFARWGAPEVSMRFQTDRDLIEAVREEAGPSGSAPTGPGLDRRIQEAVASWDADALLTMDEAFRERAGDDAVASISFLMGALDGLKVRPRILSYEGPFGVGYMVAAIDVPADEGGEPSARPKAAQADPVEPENIVAAAAGASHPLVTLARDA